MYQLLKHYLTKALKNNVVMDANIQLLYTDRNDTVFLPEFSGFFFARRFSDKLTSEFSVIKPDH